MVEPLFFLPLPSSLCLLILQLEVLYRTCYLYLYLAPLGNRTYAASPPHPSRACGSPFSNPGGFFLSSLFRVSEQILCGCPPLVTVAVRDT